MFALLALIFTGAGFGWLGYGVYRVVTDSFVAPSILSPDSDMVLANKLRFSELVVERARAAAEMESLEADLSAADIAIQRLKELRSTASAALRWTTDIHAVKTTANTADLRVLADQKRVLESMLERQRELTKKAQADVEAGLLSRTDYAREAQALTQIEFALLENERTAAQSRSAQQEVLLAGKALARREDAPAMPELIARQEQSVRLELELTRLQSERRSKLAQKRALAERLAKIDELSAQLKSRPIFQATERNVEVAFVPYTQIDGVDRGAAVYSCLWGLFFCEEVGAVSELVPGEVILPDPWGTQARGQYAVLDLRDHSAAKSKILRVRARRTEGDKRGSGVPAATALRG